MTGEHCHLKKIPFPLRQPKIFLRVFMH
uniref:Uncharacterized protein n=1 Tax=Anguilla anguilla TaxID=7936 RepID=A0A0E9RU42_ANGAN